MGITQAIMSQIVAAITGNSFTTFTNAHTFVGVGDSTTAFSNTQTDLQASTNKYYQQADSTYPSVSSNVITVFATFGTANANFSWAEWGVFSATGSSGSSTPTGATMLNRSVTFTGGSPGTKTSSQSWQLQATLQFIAS